jgi:hypothetical protein
MSNLSLYQQFLAAQQSPESNPELVKAMEEVHTHADLLKRMSPAVKVTFLPEVPVDLQDPEGKWLKSKDFPIETVTVSIGDPKFKAFYLSMINDQGDREAEHVFYGAKDLWAGRFALDITAPTMHYYTRSYASVPVGEDAESEEMADLQQRIGIIHSTDFNERTFKRSIRLNGHSMDAQLWKTAARGWYRVVYTPLSLRLKFATHSEQLKHDGISFMAFGSPIVINVGPHYEFGRQNFKLQNLAMIWREQMVKLAAGTMTMDEVLADRATRIETSNTNKIVWKELNKQPEEVKTEVVEEIKTGTATVKIRVFDTANPSGAMVDTKTLLDNGKFYDVMNGGKKPFAPRQTFSAKAIGRQSGVSNDLYKLNSWVREGGKWLVESR